MSASHSSRPATIRRRRRRRKSGVARLVWLIAGVLLASGSLGYRAFRTQLGLTHGFTQPEAGRVLDPTADSPVRAALEHLPQRPVYPYSVIRGGVYSAAEFNAALKQDPVAAAHYAGFRRESLAIVRAPRAMPMYASYRMGSAVYWTSHRVHVAAGEALITDGVNLARARCGNRLSDSPQEPVTRMEPMEREMETPDALDLGGQAAGDSQAGDSQAGDSVSTPKIPAAPVSALAFELFPAHEMLVNAPVEIPLQGLGPWPIASLPSPGLAPMASDRPFYENPEPPGQPVRWFPVGAFQSKAPASTIPEVPVAAPPALPGLIAGIETFPKGAPGNEGITWSTPNAPPATTSQPLPGIPATGEPAPVPGPEPEPEPEPVIGAPDAALPGPKIVPEPVSAVLVCAGLVFLWMAAKRFSPSSR